MRSRVPLHEREAIYERVAAEPGAQAPLKSYQSGQHCPNTSNSPTSTVRCEHSSLGDRPAEQRGPDVAVARRALWRPRHRVVAALTTVVPILVALRLVA